MLISIFDDPGYQSWDGSNLFLHLPEHFPSEIHLRAVGQPKRGAFEELGSDMVEQGTITRIPQMDCQFDDVLG